MTRIKHRKFTLLNRVPLGKFNGVNALIRGDLFSMRQDNVPSKITGRGPPVSQCPGTENGRLCLVCVKRNKDEQTELAALYGVIRMVREQESA
ncbi:hypothetical protein KFV02_04455 [Desulfohalobiaceae bacterium Ax17]|uniref:hypothetical protein n=1 Tax=Desulfovulcanus ferrireducens TaxID=2831190 RepID=UPI00207B987B|nr:hypothetical protein [Desulfovulcanus ferrireducens]MBT8763179.1 hypothetical protein [Desulfovulcanus ferrireducens]